MKMWMHSGRALSRLTVLALGVMGAAVRAEGGAQKFYKAFYLEHAGADWSAACKLYEESVADSSLDAPLRGEAKTRLAACKEELACKDFAALMPPDVMAYVELRQPGDQVLRLLDQLGLLGNENGGPKDEALAKAGRYLAVSPTLIRELLGVRGVALAVTGFDPGRNMPTGVLVFHPGEVEAVRGVLATGLPAGAVPTDAIQGFSTYFIENTVLVTLTHRLVVVGLDRASIDAVVQRLQGQEAKSLATNPRVDEALKNRDDSLLYFLVDAKTVMPHVEKALAHSQDDGPEMAMAKVLLDPNSLQSVVGKLGVNDAGLFLDLGLTLDKNHHNLVFNLFRSAAINKDTLKCVPGGVAAFLVGALNDPSSRYSSNAAKTGETAPIVTAMDLGREVFANITSFAVFVMPPGASEVRTAQGPPIPDVAIVISVNDPSKTQAIWQQALGIASMAGGAPTMDGTTEKVEGLEVRAFKLPDGVTIHSATLDNDVLITPSRAALAAAIRAKRSNKSVLNDPVFTAGLSRLGPGSTNAIFVHPARCAEVAGGLPGGKEGLREIEPFLPLLSSTVASVVVEHSGERLGLSGSVTGVPKVGRVVANLLQKEQGSNSVPATAEIPARTAKADKERKDGRSEKSPKPDKPKPSVEGGLSDGPKDAKSLQTKFAALAKKGEYDAAKEVAKTLAKELADNAQALNNFAWALLTEKDYAGKFSDLALRTAERANELTQHKLWAYLDTLALARFENGDVDGAIKVQKKAIELAGEKSSDELEERLARFEAAAKSKP